MIVDKRALKILDVLFALTLAAQPLLVVAFFGTGVPSATRY
ncbi:MAG: hypothetical protein ACK5H2_10350 [Beutenbergiaceae bacterium]